MYVLITYDVSTQDKAGQGRLRKVAKACINYGHRVQNSVFECELSESDLCILKETLRNIIDMSSDSIRIYHLNKNERSRVLVLGVETALDFGSPIII